jgi:hypothetical protein
MGHLAIKIPNPLYCLALYREIPELKYPTNLTKQYSLDGAQTFTSRRTSSKDFTVQKSRHSNHPNSSYEENPSYGQNTVLNSDLELKFFKIKEP